MVSLPRKTSERNTSPYAGLALDQLRRLEAPARAHRNAINNKGHLATATQNIDLLVAEVRAELARRSEVAR
jgi:hypothetical protein